MKVIMRAWHSAWLSVLFDTETGRGKTRWLRRVPKSPGGWACKHRGTWYAVWSNGVDLIFQASSTQLEMTQQYQCSSAPKGKRREFTIRDHERTLIELTYDSIEHRWDPTFDATDLEMEDFFVWVCGLWNDAKWRDAIMKSLPPRA